MRKGLFAIVLLLGCAVVVRSQDRPLVTERATTVPQGKLRTELGFEFLQDATFRLSGLKGDLTRIGVIGLRAGVGSRAEIQLGWTAFQFLNVDQRFPGPNSAILDFAGNSTGDFGDVSIGAKLRLLDASGKMPAIGFRFATELPNGRNERGISNDETGFQASFLFEKELRKAILVSNLGVAILGDPDSLGAQDDLLAFGIAALVPVTQDIRVFAEWYGRAGPGGIGTEEQSRVRAGAQIDVAGLYWDAAVFFGLRDTDPATGVIVGLSKDFNLSFLK